MYVNLLNLKMISSDHSVATQDANGNYCDKMFPRTATTCLVCRVKIVHKIKICTSNIGTAGVSRWKYLPLGSLCLLFGLPVDHPLIDVLFPDKEITNQLCNRCFEDLSNIHYVYWQLHNLECKLAQLQGILFQRLKDNYNAIPESESLSGVPGQDEDDLNGSDKNSGVSVAFDKIVQSLFEEIKLGEHAWPKSTYIASWKKAEEYFNGAYGQLEAENSSFSDDPFQTAGREYVSKGLQPKEEVVDYDYPDVHDNDDALNYGHSEDDDGDWDNTRVRKKSKKQTKEVREKKNCKKIRMGRKTMNRPSTDGAQKGTGLLKLLCIIDPDICNRTFGRRKDLNLHIKQFHIGRTHICEYEGCVQKFLSKRSLIKHKIRQHDFEKPKEFHCVEDPDICNRVYSTKRDLNEHIKGFHIGRNYICDQDGCAKKFLTAISLSRHKTKAHSYEDNITKFRICEICGASVNSNHMTAHFRYRHLGHSKFTCERCSMNFSDVKQLKEHEQLHDQVSQTLPFTCVVTGCKTIFTCSQELKSHVINQHVTNWLKCEVCGVTKPNEFILKAHMKVHGRVKDVICDECPKTFFTNAALKQHKQDYHMGTKYTCTICDKELTLKKSYDRHMKSHQEKKSVRCSVCPKSFNNKESLKRHEQVHSGCKNYECKLCGKKFKQAQNLRQHLNTQFHKGTTQKQDKSDIDVKMQ